MTENDKKMQDKIAKEIAKLFSKNQEWTNEPVFNALMYMVVRSSILMKLTKEDFDGALIFMRNQYYSCISENNNEEE